MVVQVLCHKLLILRLYNYAGALAKSYISMISVVHIVSSLITLTSSHVEIGKADDYMPSIIPELKPQTRFGVRGATTTTTELEKCKFVIRRPANLTTKYQLLVDLSIGTPPQKIDAELDFKRCGTYIGEAPQRPPELGPRIFIPSESNTYRQKSRLLLPNTVKFPDKWGTWGMDKLSIDKYVLEQFRFLGVRAPRSVLGLGRCGLDYHTQFKNQEERSNIFNQLKLHGSVLRYVYSIWIGRHKPDARGVMYLNAVNRRYFLTAPSVFKMLDLPGESGFFVRLNGVRVYLPDGTLVRVANTSIPVKLDFSSKTSKLPTKIVERMYQEFGITWEPSLPCKSIGNYQLGLMFSRTMYVTFFRQVMGRHDDNKEMCEAPFYPGEQAVIGANILGELYLVFDLDNNEVAIAFVDDRKKKDDISVISTEIPGTRHSLFSNTFLRNTVYLACCLSSSSSSYVEESETSSSTKATKTITLIHDES